MGVNGYQYINDNYYCMVCDDPSSCSNCDEIRVLPWVQDVPSTFNDNYSSQNDCENAGFEWSVGEQIIHDDMDQITCEENGWTWFHTDCIEYVYGCVQEADVWGNWDITLRDLVIVDRAGYEVARLNLTYTNPDPNSTCGENYQTIKDLIISAR